MELGAYLNKGCHLVCDNFFTSIPLIKHLYDKGNFYTGRVRRTRKHLPPRAKEIKFNVGEKRYFRKDAILLLAFREKQSQSVPVLVVSSKGQPTDVQKVKRLSRNRQKIITKPQVIRQYSDYMGGIDTSDMMLYAYLDERKSVKYWKKVVFNVMGRMVLNSYILYKQQCTEKPMSRYDFMVSIIEYVSDEWLPHRNRPHATQPVAGNPRDPKSLITLPDKKERNCCVCSAISTQQGGKRKKARTACNKCSKGCHGTCFHLHKCN